MLIFCTNQQGKVQNINTIIDGKGLKAQGDNVKMLMSKIIAAGKVKKIG